MPCDVDNSDTYGILVGSDLPCLPVPKTAKYRRPRASCLMAWRITHGVRRQLGAHMSDVVRTKRIPELSAAFAKRFWGRLDTVDQDVCWIWKGARSSGRGTVRAGRMVHYAPRIAYHLSVPAWDQSLYILHTCDNPLCCNPKHLFTGTAQDNATDRDRKGRHRPHDISGSKHPLAVLTEADIPAIRMACARGETKAQVARQYGVDPSAISRIASGKRWPHVKTEEH